MTITYKLAKQLKDSGFPQIKNGKGLWWNLVISSTNGVRDDHWQLLPTHWESPKATYAYTPTLSELIQACGDRFEHLKRLSNGKWEAEAGRFDWGATNYSTPEEAVANLWLVLNKK